MSDLYKSPFELHYEQELARTLADVGVRGSKFYLAARLDQIDESFVGTHILEGVKGVSSSKDIWSWFTPSGGRNLLFVMDAQETLKSNKLKRVGYNDPDKLIANNSSMLCRILSTTEPMDNLIQGVFSKIPNLPKYTDDLIAVANRAQSIAHDLRMGRNLADSKYFKHVDISTFKDGKLNLSTYDAYANLFYQAAKAADWYGKDCAKFFAPQNKSKWLPAIKAGIIAQANVYADEAEWVTKNNLIKIPIKGTIILAAIEDRMLNGGPKPRPITWSSYDEKNLQETTINLNLLEKAGYTIRYVNVVKTQKGLESTHFKRRDKQSKQ